MVERAFDRLMAAVAIEREDNSNQGTELLRDTLEKPYLKPSPAMPGWGDYSGPLPIIGNPRYGDANFGDEAWEKARQNRNPEQGQSQDQQRRQER